MIMSLTQLNPMNAMESGSPKIVCMTARVQRSFEEFEKCKGDIGKVLGDTKSEAGAWVQINLWMGEAARMRM